MLSMLVSKIRKPNLFNRIIRKIGSFFYLSQWVILTSTDADHNSMTWKKFKPLLPPLDRFWADPFIWEKDNTHYLFIEEYIYPTRRGRIACLTLDNNLNITSNKVVLERPYHLSYPFLIEIDGHLFMIPETRENNGIEVYRCINFPDKWEYVKTIIPNIQAVDATLVKSGEKWWLFATVNDENGTTWDSLHLFYSDHPLSSHWTAHPKNPIINNVKSARPAGRIFSYNNHLIRPSQDCSRRYGYAINFNRIKTLNETDYEEIHETCFAPPKIGKFIAAHTYNKSSGLAVIDATILRWKLGIGR